MMVRPRLFEERDGKLYTLFHGVDGSRCVPEGQWLEADMKIAYDGSNKRSYRTGFHVFADGHARDYAARFTAPRRLVLVDVEVDGEVWPKPTNPEVLLAQRMRVPVGADRKVVKEG